MGRAELLRNLGSVADYEFEHLVADIWESIWWKLRLRPLRLTKALKWSPKSNRRSFRNNSFM